MTESSILKLLNSSLPEEFPFVDKVENVILSLHPPKVNILKLRILLDKQWVVENFDKDSLEMVNYEYELYGRAWLTPFVLYSASDVDVYSENNGLEEYIRSVLSFSGLEKVECTIINLSFLID